MRLVTTFAALAGLSLAALSAHATTFSDGEFVTYEPAEYGNYFGSPLDPSVATLLENNFNTVFAPSGLLTVGISSPAGFSMTFDSADAVIAYLPLEFDIDDSAPLTANLVDPTSSPSGPLGYEVVAATLNIALSDAGLLAHPPGVAFGDLVFQNLDLLESDTVGPEITELDGVSVRAFLSDAKSGARRRREPVHSARHSGGSRRHGSCLRRRWLRRR